MEHTIATQLYRRAFRKAVRTAMRPVKAWRIARASRRLSAGADDPEAYRQYVVAQLRHTMSKSEKDASFRLRPYVEFIKGQLPDLGPDSAILCIGPRNETELDIFAEHGFRNVTAIDLMSTSPRILLRDMHDMGFEDSTFDLVFASHSFEHSYDFGKVASEVTRVLRDGGLLFCAVPTGFEPNAHDRYDYKDSDTLRGFFPGMTQLLHEHRKVNEVQMLLRVHKTPVAPTTGDGIASRSDG